MSFPSSQSTTGWRHQRGHSLSLILCFAISIVFVSSSPRERIENTYLDSHNQRRRAWSLPSAGRRRKIRPDVNDDSKRQKTTTNFQQHPSTEEWSRALHSKYGKSKAGKSKSSKGSKISKSYSSSFSKSSKSKSGKSKSKSSKSESKSWESKSEKLRFYSSSFSKSSKSKSGKSKSKSSKSKSKSGKSKSDKSWLKSKSLLSGKSQESSKVYDEEARDRVDVNHYFDTVTPPSGSTDEFFNETKDQLLVENATMQQPYNLEEFDGSDELNNVTDLSSSAEIISIPNEGLDRESLSDYQSVDFNSATNLLEDEKDSLGGTISVNETLSDAVEYEGREKNTNEDETITLGDEKEGTTNFEIDVIERIEENEEPEYFDEEEAVRDNSEEAIE